MSKHTSKLSHEHHTAEDTLLTVAEVAKTVRCDDTTVRRWAKNGSLEVVTLPHVGKRQAYRIKQSILDKILNPPAEAVV